MFITCPSCSTRYQLDGSRLGPRGRKVRCTRCKHEWAERPEAAEQPAPAGDAFMARTDPVEIRQASVASTLSAPARVVTRPPAKRSGVLIGWLVLIAVVAGAGAALWFAQAQIVALWPPAARLYAMIGPVEPPKVPGEGLTLKGIKTETIDDNGTATLVITGTVVNTSPVPRDVPKMSAALRDANAQEIRQWTFEVEAKRLLPGESVPFETRAQNPPQDAKGLAIVFVADSAPR
jgi:predicted Zn finger-like uncharacterized protein